MLKPVEALTDSGKPGLEIFLIREVKPPSKGLAAVKIAAQQNYEPEYEAISIPEKQYGTFYSGELYVIINTVKNATLLTKELHIWFGKDYSETPPKWINNFDYLDFDWNVVTHFEIQDNECEVFENYFKEFQPLIRYMDGRYPNVDTSATSVFYKVIRIRHGSYRVKEIPFDMSLMNQDDCFILDTHYNTRAYVSNKTSISERRKTIAATNFIREKDHNKEGNVEVVDLMVFPEHENKESSVQASEFLQKILLDESEEENVVDFTDKRPETVSMHSLTKTCILNRDNTEEYPPRFSCNLTEDEVNRRKVTLSAKVQFILRYGIFYMLGKLQIKPETKDYPKEENFVKTAMKRVLLRDFLETKKLYILEEAVRRGVYIWVGKECDKKLQEEVTEWIHHELRRGIAEDQKKPARWLHAMKIPEGKEPVKFKQYFQKWDCPETAF